MRRIGLIVPSSNTTVEPEFRRMAPEDTTIHSARMHISENTISGLRRMEKDAEEAASLLGDADVDIICYACTSGSFYGGMNHERELAGRLERAAGVPAITTSEAVISALKTLQIKRVAVATPYIGEINKRLTEFFEASGLQVVKLSGLEIIENLTVGRQDPNVAYRLAKSVDSGDAEGIFISCTNFRTIEVISRLETELGKPVTSANVATFWYALRRLKREEEVGSLGRLLRAPIKN